MKFGRAIGLSAIVLAASGISSAQADYERHGWYFGLEAGAVIVEDSELPALGYESIKFDRQFGTDAYGVLGRVGYAFEGNWRLELEGGYRHNGIDEIDVAYGPNAGLGYISVDGGRLREFTGFINALYDIPLSRRWSLNLGGGIGFDNVSLDIPDIDGLGGMAPISIDNTVLAGQGIAGLAYKLSQHWDLTLNYRYLNAAEVSLTGEVCSSGFSAASLAVVFVVVPPVTCIPETDSLAMTKHTVSIGLVYGYDAPEEAPVVTPEPIIPPRVKQFIIFFGFNKCNITAEADAVLSEAAASAREGGSARVSIVGHTDTVGTPAANQKLSECRANAARANLVSKGVSENSISASGKGESELMVQTGDGTKEPQNRRATIGVE